MAEEMEYIDGLQTNNSVIIQKIYDEYFSLIKTFILKNRGKKDETRDIFQDALLIIFEKSKQKGFKLEGKFSTFLYGVCRNLWRNKLRKISGNEVTILDTMTYIDDYSIEQDLHKKAQIVLYKEKFEELGTNCQKILELYFIKTSMERIAEIMKYAGKNAAKQRKHKCAKQLIKKIQADHRFKELKD